MVARNPVAHYGKPMIAIIVAVVGIAAAILQFGGEDLRSDHGEWIAAVAVHWIAICYLVWLAFDLRQSQFALPEVKSFRAETLTLLTSKKEWLGMGTSVSVYRRDAEFEKLLSAGEVVNLQQNELVAIQLVPAQFGVIDEDHLVQEINSAGVANLIVRPGLLRRTNDA